ncbi:NAD(P)-binding protein [Hymenopellis radicata]|nr:NAD(P)-binding protein [Hymenopellis radicata]
MDLLILSAPDVNRIVAALAPDELTSLMKGVFHPASFPDDSASCPPRLTLPSPLYTALVMPARLPAHGSSVKVVSIPKASSSGLPASTIILDDLGRVKALVNARKLTAIRNAAASLLSTELLYKEWKPASLVCFGSGAQIHAHISLFSRAYPSIENVTVVVRRVGQRTDELISTLNLNIKCSVTEHVTDDLLAEADIIICATPSTTPLFDLPSPSPASKPKHIILIGSYTPDMHEVPPSVFLRASTVVLDDKDACLREAGELIDAVKLGLDVRAGKGVMALGELIAANGSGSGKEDAREHLTIFKSVGMGLQDVAIASLVYERAVQMGAGVSVTGYDSA